MRQINPIVIIGAGPAGLTAAHRLCSQGRRVVVVEALDVVGGLSRTVPTEYGRMDLGGHRFFTKEDIVNEFWHDVAPDLMKERQRLSRILYRGHMLDYPVRLCVDTFRAMGVSGTLRAAWGYACARVHKRHEASLEDFYINRFGRGLYEMFFESYTNKVWGVHPSGLSPDWGAQRVKSLSVSKVIKDMFGHGRRDSQGPMSLTRRFEYPPLGPGQLWERVAKQISGYGGEVLTGHKVSRICVDRDGHIYCVVLDDGKSIDCDTVLSSMPLRDLAKSIDGGPDDPEARKAAEALPYRDFITVGMPVLKRLIKRRLPDNWIYIQDASVRLGRIQVFNNWSADMVSDPDNIMWLGLEYFADRGEDLWNMDDGRFISMAIDELITIGLIDSREAVVENGAVRINVPDAYPTYMGSYAQMDRIRRWLDGIHGLWPVGRAGQHRYNNMDHSMLTAMYAADAILGGSEDRAPVWSVNTSEEYHEG